MMRVMGRTVLAAIVTVGLSVLSYGDPGLGAGGMAYAGGDGGSKDDSTAPKSKPDKKKPAKKKLAHVPDTDDLRAPKGPQARMHDRLESYARKDGLKGLGTSLKRLKKFRKALDKLIRNARTREEKRKAGEILTQLRRYRNQGKNPVLKENANRILKSLVALDALAVTEAAESAFYEAKLTTKGIGDDLETHEDYKDAVREYEAALKDVPKVPRTQFPRFERTLLKD